MWDEFGHRSVPSLARAGTPALAPMQVRCHLSPSLSSPRPRAGDPSSPKNKGPLGPPPLSYFDASSLKTLHSTSC